MYLVKFFKSTLPFCIGTVLLLPLLMVMASAFNINATSLQIMQNMVQSVLPDYSFTSILLCLGVGFGTLVVGTFSAVLVTQFNFFGRNVLEWLLLLPLAMPSYVVAYAYTSFFDDAPSVLKLHLDMRNSAGAIFILVFCLYPYVYVLVRAALAEQATHLLEVAHSLGASWGRSLLQVALPLVRPAMAAGVALAIMETLTDYGVASYMGIGTFTVGIYKAWLIQDNRTAATQLALILLVVMGFFMHMEQKAQKKIRFISGKNQATFCSLKTVHSSGTKSEFTHQTACDVAVSAHTWVLGHHQTVWAWVAGFIPVLMGFVLPLGFMGRVLIANYTANDIHIQWTQFAGWVYNSLRLAGMAAVITVGLAMYLGWLVRIQKNPKHPHHLLIRLASMGYAIPTVVVVVGVLLPLGWINGHVDANNTLENAVATTFTFLMTGSTIGLLWAYAVRFTGVALQSVQSGYTQLPVSFDEVNHTLKGENWQLWRQVHLPLLQKPMAAAALLVFVDVMKELPATLVLRPFNTDTLAVMTHQLARDERLGDATLPALALVIVGLLPVMLLSKTLRKTP